METLHKPRDNKKYSLRKNYTDLIINIQNNINQGNSKNLIANSSIHRNE